MPQVDEEVYSTMFNALRHGVRRRILRMLSEKRMTFTAINDNLSISSSHLTYHIDSLGELVSKNNSDYRLSVFGRAAVEMMMNVENPPYQKEIFTRPNLLKVTAGLLIITIVAVSALSVNLYTLSNRHRELNIAYELSLDELEATVSELEVFQELESLIINRPFARFGSGLEIISGYNLEYEQSRTNSHFDHSWVGPRVVFYSPQDNLTLRMYSFISLIESFIPLTIQIGNAYQNESGVLVEIRGEETIWQSPILRSLNITENGVYDVHLPSKGWYTISMIGPIRRSSGGGFKGRLLGQTINGTFVPDENVRAWVDFKLLRDAEPVLFGLSTLWSGL